jgi:hypothetical protein
VLLELNRVDLLHEALERFVRRIGQAKVGSFGVSMPRSENVRLLDIEFDFAGYRDRCLRQHFRSGIWTVERQKVTRDWHVHALVELGFDGQTGFPFEAIKRKITALSRNGSASCGNHCVMQRPNLATASRISCRWKPEWLDGWLRITGRICCRSSREKQTGSFRT